MNVLKTKNNWQRRTSIRRTAPLRKIVGFVSHGDNSLFGSGDRMKLECGHEVYTKSDGKARCVHCLSEQSNLEKHIEGMRKDSTMGLEREANMEAEITRLVKKVKELEGSNRRNMTDSDYDQ